MGKAWITFLMFILFCLFVIFSILDKSSKEEKKIKIILNSGVFLVVTSSVIFTVSTWDTLSDMFKILFMLCETAIFILFGMFLKYGFNVRNTGSALNTIGIALFNVTYLCAGGINVFKTDFSLLGKYKYIYLIALLILNLVISLLYKKLNNKKSYIVDLLLIILIPFLISMQLVNDVVFSLMISSLFMLILNLTRSRLFKNQLAFNVINIVITLLLSFAYLVCSIYQIDYLNEILFGRITLALYALFMIINAFIYVYKSSNIAIAILVPLYAVSVAHLYGIFSLSASTASLAVVILSIVIYIIHIITKDKAVKIAFNIYSYLFAFESILIMCFSTKFTVLSIILSALFVIISSINVYIKKDNRILDRIARAVFIIMLIISVIIQPQIIDKIGPMDILMIFNVSMFICYFVNEIKNNGMKVVYQILLLLGTIISLFAQYYVGAIYGAIMAFILVTLFIYYYAKKKDIFRAVTYFLLTISVLVSFHNSLLLASIVLIVLSIILSLASKDKYKAIYLVMGYIPLCVFVNSLPITYNGDIRLMIYIALVFAFVLPVTVLLKDVFKAPEFVIQLVDSILIAAMFLSFISVINIYVALILGTTSIVILLVGYIINYKSFIYEGYIFMFLTIIVQTSSLLKELPWWIYLLFAGILLLIIALIKEVKRKNKTN